jgi:hypothetical protein
VINLSNLVNLSSIYTISSANTKEVNTNGRRSVNQGQCVAIAKMSSALKKKNTNQYNPFDLFFISMLKSFGKNRESSKY